MAARQLPKVVVTDKGFNEFMDKLIGLGRPGYQLTIGFHEDSGEAADEDGNALMTMAALGAIHEFGTENVPERSFLRAWFDEHGRDVAEAITTHTKYHIMGSDDERTVMERIGEACVGQIKARIQGHIPPPLKLGSRPDHMTKLRREANRQVAHGMRGANIKFENKLISGKNDRRIAEHPAALRAKAEARAERHVLLWEERNKERNRQGKKPTRLRPLKPLKDNGPKLLAHKKAPAPFKPKDIPNPTPLWDTGAMVRAIQKKVERKWPK